MEKKSIIVYLASDFHARSFFSGRLFDSLISRFNLTILKSSDVNLPINYSTERVFTVGKSQVCHDYFAKYLDGSLVRNLHKSRSFRFRLKRYLVGDYKTLIGFSPRGLLRFFKAVFLALPGVYQKVCDGYREAVITNSQLAIFARDHKPDLIVCWAQSMEPAVLESILIAKKLNILSMVVYDNWDNLSSKTVMLDKPDHLVCFGETSKKFAERIHKVPIKSIHSLGSARFDAYVSNSPSHLGKRSEVLIAGSSIALEDHAILNVISKELRISSRREELEDFTFFYRPHPAPQGPSAFFDVSSYHGIKLDEFCQTLHSRKIHWQNQQDLAKSLFKKKLVIASPTTLLLEALLAGCQVIVPALNVKGIKTSNRKMLGNLEHLRDISNLPNLKIVYDSKELISALYASLKSPQISFAPIELNGHLTTRPGDFSSRFVDLVSSIS